jgi:hypothetical protein
VELLQEILTGLQNAQNANIAMDIVHRVIKVELLPEILTGLQNAQNANIAMDIVHRAVDHEKKDDDPRRPLQQADGLVRDVLMRLVRNLAHFNIRAYIDGHICRAL